MDFTFPTSDRPKDSNRFLRLRSHVGLGARRLRSQISQNIDPLTAALIPPASESFAQRQIRRFKEIDARRVSDAIDEDLEKERARMVQTQRKERARRDSIASARVAFASPEEEEAWVWADQGMWSDSESLDPVVVMRKQLKLFALFLGFEIEDGEIEDRASSFLCKTN